jgi:uncharacterized membrane protein
MNPNQPSNGLSDNVAGMLAYITVIPALVLLFLEPYKQRRFIRFHAFQSLFFYVATVVVRTALGFAIVPLMVMHLSILTGLLFELFGLLVLVGWVVCVVKAYQGEMFRLPIIGDLASQQAVG